MGSGLILSEDDLTLPMRVRDRMRPDPIFPTQPATHRNTTKKAATPAITAAPSQTTKGEGRMS